MESDTSTPDHKRGKHPEELTQLAIREITKDGLEWPLPGWIQKQKAKTRSPSALILADSQFKHWPRKDHICQVILHEGWPLKRWSQAIKLGQLHINSHTVTLYLESVQYWTDMPPIKNGLTSLCRVIKSHGMEPRIFVSNHLPRWAASPVTSPVSQFNFTLQQGIRSTCRSIGSVYELSLYKHFTSAKGRIIKPADKYFELGSLSWFGCVIARECILREVGLKGYWFEEHGDLKNSQKCQK